MAVVIGLVGGLLLGLTGAGGGVVAVPLLAAGLNLPLTVVAPMALLAVALTASGAAMAGLRRGIVRYRAAFVIAGTGLLIAPIGQRLAAQAPEAWLWSAFAIVMLGVSARMFMASRRDPVEYGSLTVEHQRDALCPRDRDTGRFVWGPRVSGVMAGIGTLAGFLSGLLGVGGGFVIVPALRAVSDLDMHGAVATSLLAIALIAIGTVGWSLLAGHQFELVRVSSYVIGAGVGTMVGRTLANRVPARRLQQLFAWVMAVVALVMLLRNG